MIHSSTTLTEAVPATAAPADARRALSARFLERVIEIELLLLALVARTNLRLGAGSAGES